MIAARLLRLFINLNYLKGDNIMGCAGGKYKIMINIDPVHRYVTDPEVKRRIVAALKELGENKGGGARYLVGKISVQKVYKAQ
jgi:hypothetical protein